MRINYTKYEEVILLKYKQMVISRIESSGNIGSTSFYIRIQDSKPEWYFLDVSKFDKAIESLVNENILKYKKNKLGYISKIELTIDTVYALMETVWMDMPSINQLIEYCNNYEEYVIYKFKCRLDGILSDKKSIKKYLNSKWFKAIEAVVILESLQEEILERDFSKMVFGNSKSFNKYKHLILDIYEVEINKNSFLINKGIIKMYSPILIKGKIKISLNKSEFIDLKLLKYLGISVDTDCHCLFNDFNILTIENMATFNDFNNNGFDLIIYTGGFCNSKLIELLKSFKNVKYWHWGDLDVGGFKILKHLRSSGIKVSSYNMDIIFATKFANHFSKIDSNKSINVDKYLNSLVKLVTDNLITDSEKATMNYLIENKIWLEQESYYSIKEKD